MKSRKHLFFLVCLMALGLYSCKDSGSKNGNHEENPFTAEEMAANSASLLSPASCSNLPENQYCVQGLWFMQMGDTLTWAQLEVPGATVRDTVFEQVIGLDSTAWNVKVVNFADGQIILESDFNTFALLSRVRIEKPGIVNVHGIGVGSTVGEFLQTYGKVYLSLYPEMELIELGIEGSSNLLFHVPDPGNKLQNAKGETLSLDDLDKSAKISRVVIWDNTVGNPV